MKKFTLGFCLLIACHIVVFAQPKQGQELIDSLLMAANSNPIKNDSNAAKTQLKIGGVYLSLSEFEKGIDHAQKALLLSKEANWSKGQADAYYMIGSASIPIGKYQDAINNYDNALQILEQMGDLRRQAGAYHNKGNALMNIGSYKRALEVFFKALAINERIGNKQWIGYNLNNIGLLYLDQKQYPDALIHFQKALVNCQELNDYASQNHPYNNIGNCYFEMGKYDVALTNYLKALEIRRDIGDLYEEGNSCSNVGACYEALLNYSEAEKFYLNAMKIDKQVGNLDGIAIASKNLADLKRKQGKLSEAQLYIDSSYQAAKEINSFYCLESSYSGMAALDSAKGDYKNALLHYKLAVLYRDSIVNDENKSALVQQQMQYDFDKKDAEAKAQQDIKDAIALEELEKQKLIRNGFIAGFGFVFIFALTFFTQRNRIKKGKKLSDSLLLNILPEEVAEELKAKGEADAKLINEVTVLFTDFKGFTAMSEKLSPKELVKDIHECFSAFDRIMEKHNIEKIKTIGDSYMAAGGLPTPNGTHAEDVIKAALEIRQFISEGKARKIALNEPYFEIRIGIHTGPVVAGIVGVKKFAYDIWGDTVNTASRMESSGEVGSVNISGTTYAIVHDKFACTYRGKIQAKGKGEIDMYFVDELHSVLVE